MDLPTTDGIFDQDDVRDGIQLITGWIADTRDFEPWRLDEAKAGKLARPYTTVLNGLWQKYAPLFLARLSASTPGLMQAAVMSALVFGPVVKADLARKKSKGLARDMVRESTSHHAEPQTPKPTMAGSMLYTEGRAE